MKPDWWRSSLFSEVEVAEVMVPIAPSLKTTLLFATIGSKPEPLITIVFASANKFVVSAVTLTLNSVRSSRHSR